MCPRDIAEAVIDGVRIRLGFRVAAIPAFDKLAALSRERYGKRFDESYQARHDLFKEL